MSKIQTIVRYVYKRKDQDVVHTVALDLPQIEKHNLLGWMASSLDTTVTNVIIIARDKYTNTICKSGDLFQNDVVEFKDGHGKKHHGIIKAHKDGSFDVGFEFADRNWSEWFYDHIYDLKILGNIHQDKKLLEKLGLEVDE